MDLNKAVNALRMKRPAFHSEADFQFALAWEIQTTYPNAEIRLEYPAVKKAKEYVDILIKHEGSVYPVELKYKTRKLSFELGDESYNLKNHGAGDFGSYDFVKDICRLEGFTSNIDGYKQGYAIWLTNDPYYWNPPRKSNTGAAAFRVYHGSTKTGTLAWGSAMTNTHGRESPLTLTREYTISWQDYSEVTQGSMGIFKYALIEV